MTHTKSLTTHTRQLLKDRPASLTFEKICAETNLKMNWLTDFSRARSEGATAERVQKLYEYLTGKPLLSDES